MVFADHQGLPIAFDVDQISMVRAALKRDSEDSPFVPWDGHTAVYMREQPGHPIFIQGNTADVIDKVFLRREYFDA